jgi:hypothetical protein
LIFSHAFDGPDLYGASSFFETMPSSPRWKTAANILSPWPSSKLNFETRRHRHPVPPAILLCPGLLGERGEGKMSRSLRCIPLIVALMLIYGTATAKGYRWSCTYSDKASPAGIETDAHLQLDFVFDDVTRKAMVFGSNGSDVDVHIGSVPISVQTTVISFAGDSTHSRHTLLSDKDLVPSKLRTVYKGIAASAHHIM